METEVGRDAGTRRGTSLRRGTGIWDVAKRRAGTSQQPIMVHRNRVVAPWTVHECLDAAQALPNSLAGERNSFCPLADDLVLQRRDSGSLGSPAS